MSSKRREHDKQTESARPTIGDHRLYWSSSLFNDVYLRQDLPRQSFWQLDEVGAYAEFQSAFLDLCAALRKEDKDNWNEPETVRQWIIPMMEILGWHDKCSKHQSPLIDNLTLTVAEEGGQSRTYKPDLIYLNDPDERPLVNVREQAQRRFASQTYTKMVVEAKAWQILSIAERREQLLNDRKKRSPDFEDDTRGLTPDEQCLKYMEILNKDFGILTDGHTWRLLHLKLSNGDTKRCFQFSIGSVIQTAMRLENDRSGAAWKSLSENLKYFYYLFRKQGFYTEDGSHPLVYSLLDYSKKYVDSIEQDLRQSFVGAMTVICNGYRDSIGRGLTEEERELVRNVSESQLFNILFIKSCETRDVLPLRNPHYYKTSLTDIEHSYFDVSISKFLDTIEFPAFNPDADKEFNSKRLSQVITARYGCSYDPDGTEIYDRLLNLYKVVQDGNYGLKINGFRETVFTKQEWSFATKHKITNDLMVRLLFQLGYTKSKTDAKAFQQIPYSYFTPRQLGSIYESFLEFTLLEAPHDLVLEGKEWVKINLKSAYAATEAKNKVTVKAGQLYFDHDPKRRKGSGSFYTPDFVVQHVLKKSLLPLVENRSSKEIAAITVCDPALGSGHFLNGALEFLARAYREALIRELKDDLEEDETESRIKLLKTSLYGCDLNPRAVKLAKMGLWLATAHASHPLETLDDQLKVGDSLIEPTAVKTGKVPKDSQSLDWPSAFPQVYSRKAAGFDCVASNPPWGADIDKILEFLHARYPHSTQEHTDSYKVFIERSLELCKDGGMIGLVVPNTVISQDRVKDIRGLLVEQQIVDVTDLGEGVFEDATVPSCIIVFKKRAPSKDDYSYNFSSVANLADNEEKELHIGESLTPVSTASVRKRNDVSLHPMLEIDLSKFSPLGDFPGLKCKDAGINYQRVSVGKQEKGNSDLADRLLYEGKREKPSHKMFWKGTDIDRYYVAKETTRFCRPETKQKLRSNEVVHFNEEVYKTVPKLLIRQTADRPIAALDTQGVWFGRSVIAILVDPKSPYAPEYFLALLNSEIMTHLYFDLAREKGRTFAQVKLGKLKQLPLRLVDFAKKDERKIHDEIVALVEKRILLANKGESAEKVDKALNEIINRLYDGMSVSKPANTQSASQDTRVPRRRRAA